MSKNLRTLKDIICFEKYDSDEDDLNKYLEKHEHEEEFITKIKNRHKKFSDTLACSACIFESRLETIREVREEVIKWYKDYKKKDQVHTETVRNFIREFFNIKEEELE
ncbi:MAG: hypothetical protein ACOCTT_03510 [archaeon]